MTPICEGACNAGRTDVLDDRVARFREQNHIGGGAMFPIEIELATALRTLVHTPHAVKLGQLTRFQHGLSGAGYHDTAVCAVCGTTRQYGGSPAHCFPENGA